MTCKEWLQTQHPDLDAPSTGFAQQVWQAAQHALIKQAWEIHGEDFADKLMEIAGLKVSIDKAKGLEDE